MGYNERLAGRIRRALSGRRGVGQIKMFGGVCFTLRGHMCCGVVGDRLVVRVGSQGYQDALAEPHARPMDFTGRALTGFLFVDAAGHRSEHGLEGWLKRAVELVHSLPAKASKAKPEKVMRSRGRRALPGRG